MTEGPEVSVVSIVSLMVVNFHPFFIEYVIFAHLDRLVQIFDGFLWFTELEFAKSITVVGFDCLFTLRVDINGKLEPRCR